MASQTLTSIIGSGGSFSSDTSSGVLTVAGGASGNVIVIPANGGQVRLTSLYCATGADNGITITCGSRTVVTSLNLEDRSAALANPSDFVIGTSSSTAINPIKEILGRIGEDITVIKDAGSTGSIFYYSFERENP